MLLPRAGLSRTGRQDRPITNPPHLKRPACPRHRAKQKPMATRAQPRRPQILAVRIGQQAPNACVTAQHLQRHRLLWRASIPRPASDHGGRCFINKPLQRPRAFTHAANSRAGAQTLLNRMQPKPILGARHAGCLRQLRARVECCEFRRIGKPLTAIGIQKTLRRAIFREDHRMPFQFNVIIVDLRQPLHLADGNPVDQPPGVYQHPVQAKRMVRRDK